MSKIVISHFWCDIKKGVKFTSQNLEEKY